MELTHFAKERERGKLCQRSHSRGRWWTLAISRHCLACCRDGLPGMASSKLPPEYIVSRRGRWAVAGSQTGTAKRKIKTITALIDQLCSWGDEKGKGILKKALDIRPGPDSICHCSQISSLPPGPGSSNPTAQPPAAGLLKVILCGRHQAVLPQELLSKTAWRKQLRAADSGLLLAKPSTGLPAAREEWGRRCQEQGQPRAGD